MPNPKNNVRKNKTRISGILGELVLSVWTDMGDGGFDDGILRISVRSIIAVHLIFSIDSPNPFSSRHASAEVIEDGKIKFPNLFETLFMTILSNRSFSFIVKGCTLYISMSCFDPPTAINSSLYMLKIVFTIIGVFLSMISFLIKPVTFLKASS